MNLRLFIAIDIPEFIRREIADMIELLKKYETDVKWIVPENIHLTLKFLGSTSVSLLESIRDALLRVVSAYAPFHIHIHGTGVFPSEKYPRVVWIGIGDSEPLLSLRNDIERALLLLGFEGEEKEFHPHLTIGRVRERRGMITLMNEVMRFRDRDFGDCLVDQVRLMKSDLKPKGPQYSCLYPISLGGSGCLTIRH
jgi:2'-5' RNA ligase